MLKLIPTFSAKMDFECEDFVGIKRVALIVPSCEEKF